MRRTSHQVYVAMGCPSSASAMDDVFEFSAGYFQSAQKPIRRNTPMPITIEEKAINQKMKEYYTSLETRTELIGELRKSLDITTDVLEKYRLKKLVEDAEKEREEIINTLKQLESEVERERLQNEKKDLI